MSRTGLLLRADQGGLGCQTRQLQQCLQPDSVLLIDLPEHQCRGDTQIRSLRHLPIYAVTRTDRIPRDLLTAFAATVDTLLTVECLYTDMGGWVAVNRLTRTVLVANPELYADYPAQQIVLPTSWHADRFPGAPVVPHPVDVEHAAPRARVRDRVTTFLHVMAPAMLDRNGSELVAAALPHVTEPCRLVVRTHLDRPRGPLRVATGKVKVVWDHGRPGDWRDCYPPEADVLLLPRRYGGLSMVVQEAAALGLPTVMLDVDPQRAEAWPGWRIPARVQRTALMRGGEFDVHTGDPEALAAVMSAMVRGEVDVAGESQRALAWARARSWPAVRERWAEVL